MYTLGNIGAHRIVSTKLPSVGSTREAMTATGNTTTRLLGTFQKVDYVFIVGVAGGISHVIHYIKIFLPLHPLHSIYNIHYFYSFVIRHTTLHRLQETCSPWRRCYFTH